MTSKYNTFVLNHRSVLKIHCVKWLDHMLDQRTLIFIFEKHIYQFAQVHHFQCYNLWFSFFQFHDQLNYCHPLAALTLNGTLIYFISLDFMASLRLELCKVHIFLKESLPELFELWDSINLKNDFDYICLSYSSFSSKKVLYEDPDPSSQK